MSEEIRIGIFVCLCGTNIASTIRCDEVVEYAKSLPHVVFARTATNPCLKPDQKKIKEDIKEHTLNRIVFASCSPRIHEETFRKVIHAAGLNKHLLEIVNIREQVSWVTDDKDKATKKAKILIHMAVAKASLLEPIEPIIVSGVPKVLIIGGGVAGISSALAVADLGIEAILVEKSPSIGGRMAQLDTTFPTQDCSICLLASKMSAIANHQKIQLLTQAEVINIAGYTGNFDVTLHKKPRYVNSELCTTCGECIKSCPSNIINIFDEGLSTQKAIFLPFPQAIPHSYVIDKLGIPPCQDGCLVDIHVQGIVNLIAQRKYKEALGLIVDEIPFPSVCREICPRPCEASCGRNQVDGSIPIRSLVNFCWEKNQQFLEEPIIPVTKRYEENVAIVGADVSGLSAAWWLAKKGYKVTIYKENEKLGELLRNIYREYKLSKNILDLEIKRILDLGIEMKTWEAVKGNGNLPFDDIDELKLLHKKGYDAVILTLSSDAMDKVNLPEGIFDKNGQLLIDKRTFQSKIYNHIFFCGEASHSSSSIIEAITIGKWVGESVHCYFRRKDLCSKCIDTIDPSSSLYRWRIRKEHVIEKIPIERAKTIKYKMTHKEQGERKLQNNSITTKDSLSEEDVITEANRCLSCANCGFCKECLKVCETKAINFEQESENICEKVGGIIIAIGAKLFNPAVIQQYHYKDTNYPDIITGMEFERLTNSSGPTNGLLLVPSTGKEPKSIAFINCVGSRNINYHEYCSRYCCSASIKQAYLMKLRYNSDINISLFYKDIRTFGKGHEELYNKTREKGVHFIKGLPLEIRKNNTGIMYFDIYHPDKKKNIHYTPDLIVLQTAMEPYEEAKKLADLSGCALDKNGFFIEKHLKLAPVEAISSGKFIAGTCREPLDISDSVAQGYAAAALASKLILSKSIEKESIIADIDQNACSGCALCVSSCMYGALSLMKTSDNHQKISINKILCEGCGACIVTCPVGAINIHPFTNKQIEAMIKASLIIPANKS